MSNPYVPPPEIPDYPSLQVRLRRGLTRARREYREGLLRDNISRSQHIWAWLSLIALGLILLNVAVVTCLAVLFALGIIS